MGRRSRLAWGTGACALVAAGLLAPPSGASPSQPAPAEGRLEIVLNGEANRLNVYDADDPARHRTLIPSAADEPGVGLDINAEICFVPEGVSWKPAGEVWFIAGEDTEQNAEPGIIKQGWGVFRLTGDTFDTLAAEQVGKFVPSSFVTEGDNPENYGCGVLPDGRVVTGDVGDQLPHSPATGQLIVWFPAASHFGEPIGPDRNDFAPIPHCKVDVSIGTAGGIHVDGTDVYIASNRPDVAEAEPGGVYRYDTTVWPTGPGAADGCGRTDPEGSALADADKVGKSLFIPQVPGLLLTPSDIVDSGRDTFYVSSVFSGQVAEFDRNGLFIRHVVNTTGQLGGITPFGMTVTRDGSLWIADIGIVGDGPAEDEGAVVRVPFDAAGNPGPMEFVDEGLQFPDGMGSIVLADGEPSAPSGPSGGDAPPVDVALEVDAARQTGGELARTGPPALPVWLAVAAAAVAVAARRVVLSAGGA